MLILFRLLACYAWAGVLLLVLLVLLMLSQQFAFIEFWLLTGKPLASLLLYGLPESFWQALTGVQEATQHPAVQSFLQFVLALAQAALLLALGFYRLWYRR